MAGAVGKASSAVCPRQRSCRCARGTFSEPAMTNHLHMREQFKLFSGFRHAREVLSGRVDALGGDIGPVSPPVLAQAVNDLAQISELAGRFREHFALQQPAEERSCGADLSRGPEGCVPQSLGGVCRE